MHNYFVALNEEDDFELNKTLKNRILTGKNSQIKTKSNQSKSNLNSKKSKKYLTKGNGILAFKRKEYLKQLN